MTEPAEDEATDIGLSNIAVPELRELLKAVQSGRVGAPLSSAGLQAAGLGGIEDALRVLGDLDKASVVAVLQAVIAERSRRPAPNVSLVWTGPEAKASRSLDTAIAVRELFQAAQRSVLVAGFSFDHGDEILRPLHEAIRDRGVEASLFINLRDFVVPGGPGDPAEAAVANFLTKIWTFGEPRPAIYYDPRTTDKWVSLHAKCVVVDERRTLVTSANFTSRGQTRNIEVGALVEDPEFARMLAAHWRGIVDSGLMARAGHETT